MLQLILNAHALCQHGSIFVIALLHRFQGLLLGLLQGSLLVLALDLGCLLQPPCLCQLAPKIFSQSFSLPQDNRKVDVRQFA